MKTLFITGISGFLGNNLLNELGDDMDIIALVLPYEKDKPFLKRKNITLIEGNILSKDDIKRFLNIKKDNKYIIHMAGKISTLKNHDPLTMDINYEGTKNIIDTALEIGDFKKFIYISSVDSLPIHQAGELIKEVDHYNIENVPGVYGKSKALANQYILDKAERIDVSILLPSALFGPNDVTLTPINKAINNFLNDKLRAITKGGYNLVDVRDVAKGIVEAISKSKNKESYILSGHYISVENLINETAKIANKKPIKFKVPHLLIKTISPFIELNAKLNKKTPLFTGFSMDCLMQNSNYDSSKAMKELGYSARDIKETLKDTIYYLKSIK